ncbi:polysaccharide biosynthesis protein [Massilia psychrophila]|uniref:Polysaccharide biosynthesis protein n=1 Tax=Massilia psychrophila TaxID=1603353 RepID=A0A2G8T1N3_9BURK|nr:nucleoside-diphosphate sugar epimerase/dehydratase [Massilia psychrophila]PIL39946.1 polysaccharide biosynthesis protein [Massilia psychrophila]GGE78415.1 nucleotide sugar epimerase/dehydratase WbpM [Massilia psychrophila]
MINRFSKLLLALPRPVKRVLALAVDAGLCVLCVWLSFGIRLDSWTFLTGAQWWAVASAIGLAFPLFIVNGLYRAIFRYSGTAALMALVKACVPFGLAYFFVFTVIQIDGVPRSIGVTVPLLMFVSVGCSRLLTRYSLGGLYLDRVNAKGLPQVVIYGAGVAGRQVAAALANNREMVVRAFVDDAPHLQGSTLSGLPIYPASGLQDLVRSQGVTDVLMAMPSISRTRRAQIVRAIEGMHLQLHVRALPCLSDLAQGKIKIQDISELDIEDLLGRDPVPPSTDLLEKNIVGRVVLVTGAGGSIGSELCRQIVRLGPDTVLLVDSSEHALYAIHHELQRTVPSKNIRVLPLLASVRDEARMREIMRVWRPQTVYHAAAYKHVPLVEHNPAEGVRNNVMGTWTTARLSAEFGVRDFVLISTDKAVRPTNIMGASKRLAEMVLQGLAQERSATRFSMVRFGNVLGSSGSVVPLFRQQIRDGGPITLTHADITRFFMTIPEAAQLVIQAGAMAVGGDVFVLDMGAPVRIIDLARRMVELSGMTVREDGNADGDIGIEITGLRPGEKLYEELLIGDNPSPTEHPRIMKAHDDAMVWSKLRLRLAALDAALESNDVNTIRQILQELVSGYLPAGEIVDWVYLENRCEMTQGAMLEVVVEENEPALAPTV